MVINCIKIDAEIYGITPNAKIDACENAPPANVSKRPSKPLLVLVESVSLFGFIPGKTI